MGERHHVDSSCPTCGKLLFVHSKFRAVQRVHAVCSFVADAQKRENARNLICVPRHEHNWTLHKPWRAMNDRVLNEILSMSCIAICTCIESGKSANLLAKVLIV